MATNLHIQELEGTSFCFLTSNSNKMNFYNLNLGNSADSIGLRLSTNACFDPNAAIRYVYSNHGCVQIICLFLINLIIYSRVQERLDRLEKRLQQMHPEYNPTHPHSDGRIKVIHLIGHVY